MIGNFLVTIEEILISLWEELGLVWWIEIITLNPSCVYYFGPFISFKEAKFSQNGYLEDLKEEKAIIVTVEIKQRQPKTLTIFVEEDSEKGNICTSDCYP
jgi:hypothetical protein